MVLKHEVEDKLPLGKCADAANPIYVIIQSIEFFLDLAEES